MLRRVTSCSRFDDTMAFERNFSFSLRYCLLIALLILIIHALSSDYGVNGEDQPDNDSSKRDKVADKGVTGAKGSESVQETNKRTRLPRRKKTTKSGGIVSSLTPPGSVTVKPAGDDPKQKQISSPIDHGDKSHLLGATGTQEAKAGDRSSIEPTDEEEDEDEKDKDIEKDDTANTDDKDSSPKKPLKTSDESQAAGLSEITYEDEDEEQDSEAEIQLNPSGNVFGESKKTPQLTKPSDNVSSAGSFMTYFVIVAIAVIILYLILHNKKKLMAYIVEGRNTSRGRRQRATAGSEYKPLKNADETPGGRPEEA